VNVCVGHQPISKSMRATDLNLMSHDDSFTFLSSCMHAVLVVSQSVAMPRRFGRRTVGGSAVARSADAENVCAAAAAANAAASALDGHTPECAEVDGVKGRLSELRTREGELQSTIDRLVAERDAVRAEVASAERELDAVVNAPVSRGRDPFEWLPDELLVMVLVMLPLATLWSGACERVCQRWARLMESSPVKRRKHSEKWAAYESTVIQPRSLEDHTSPVMSIAVGMDGKIYSASEDMTIKVWSGEDGTLLRTLVGHTVGVYAVAVGQDSKVYSGSYDRSIRVWSGEDGTLLRTLVGHTVGVYAVAVGQDSKIYSGSRDRTIRVWRGDDGVHLNTLVGHTGTVFALAIGLDGAVYSGSEDQEIRVWSGDDGRHMRTLVGHTDAVYRLAVGFDGKIYSGSDDHTIRVWRGGDGTRLQTLEGHTAAISALVVGLDGTLFSASDDGTLRVWRVDNGALVHAHTVQCASAVNALAVGRGGTLYSGDDDGNVIIW
jgi:WD40 repeat protein